MIVQHRIALDTAGIFAGPALAYPLYAWLLSNVPSEYGDALHEQGTRPISQYVYHDGKNAQWVVNLLTDETAEAFSPILERAPGAQLHQGTIAFGERDVSLIESAQCLIDRARTMPDLNRFSFELLTPTAFKQGGRYAIFPQESLMLQSLVNRWGMCFPELPLDDPDAMQYILQGINIVDYRLHTLRHSLKQTKIPSFQGRVIIETRLPAPLLEIWKTLYAFAPYAGIGIKTALGMGAVKAE